MHYRQGPSKRTAVQSEQTLQTVFVTERKNCTYVQIPDFLKISVEWLCTISSCFGSDQNTTKTNQNGTKQFMCAHSKLNLSELMLKSEVLSTSFISPHLNDVDPPFSPVMQYSQLNASFCCLFIYAQTFHTIP